MNSISNCAKCTFDTSIGLLRQPVIKERIKNIISSATFVFSVYQIIHITKTTSAKYSSHPKWVQVANKIITMCTTISLILSIGISLPAAYIVCTVVGNILSTRQINQAVRMCHLKIVLNSIPPRHVISIVATILALPSFIQTTYERINWVYKKIQQCRST